MRFLFEGFGELGIQFGGSVAVFYALFVVFEIEKAESSVGVKVRVLLEFDGTSIEFDSSVVFLSFVGLVALILVFESKCVVFNIHFRELLIIGYFVNSHYLSVIDFSRKFLSFYAFPRGLGWRNGISRRYASSGF